MPPRPVPPIYPDNRYPNSNRFPNPQYPSNPNSNPNLDPNPDLRSLESFLADVLRDREGAAEVYYDEWLEYEKRRQWCHERLGHLGLGQSGLGLGLGLGGIGAMRGLGLQTDEG